jgi:pentatricopeptide repeat protein
MSSPHICLACRRRLGQIRLRKGFQWHPRASFISLSNNAPRTIPDENAKSDVLGLVDESEKPTIKYALRVKQKGKRTPKAGSNHPGDILESLFEETLKAPPPGETAHQPFTSFEPYKHAEKLKEMISGSASLTESWHFFVEHFGSLAMRKGSTNQTLPPTYLHGAANDLLKRIIHAKSRDVSSGELPIFSKLSKVYLRLGILRGTDWAVMVNILLENILKIKDLPSRDMILEESLISDLIGAWNVACNQGRKFDDLSGHDKSHGEWTNLPIVTAKDIAQVQRKGGSLLVFGMLVPQFSVRHLDEVPIVALATYGLLTADSMSDKAYVMNASPFIAALSCVIGARNLDVSQFFKEGQRTEGSPVAQYVKDNWLIIRERASQASVPPSDKPERTSRSISLNPRLKTKLSFVNKRLHEALIMGNARDVDDLWSDVSQWPSDNTQKQDLGSAEERRGQLSKKLCNYFILVYMGIRRPNRAIDVWNHMVNAGLTPTLETWDSMLSGCKASRDPKALEDVWKKMQIVGVEPDVFCWTTRISGLIECREINPGIRALDEMGRLFLDAAQKQYPKMSLAQLQLLSNVEGAIKPTIVTINAAVAALLGKHKPEAAYRILNWAGKFGIQPDVITYNTLLRPLIREGNPKGAMELLKQMQKAGIEADVATFTTILEETFKNSDEHTPEEQREIILNIFSEMEEAGVKANMHTYSKIIYHLLQSSSGDTTSVNIVMERMGRQGLEPTSAIYTVLIEHYFDQDPPNLDAVRNLIDRSSMVVGGVDHIFWDRCIEGYARAGETASALQILGKVNDANGRLAGWLSLRTLLLALAENQEWDMARTVVKNAIVDTGGPISPDEHGKEGQHKFWNTAAELGLLGN